MVILVVFVMGVVLDDVGFIYELSVWYDVYYICFYFWFYFLVYGVILNFGVGLYGVVLSGSY